MTTGKGKMSQHTPWKHRGEAEVWLHSFSALDLDELSASRPGHFAPTERTAVSPTASLNVLEKKKSLLLQPGIEPRIGQSVVYSLYSLSYRRSVKRLNSYIFTNNLSAMWIRRQHKVLENNGRSNAIAQLWKSTLKRSETEKRSGRDNSLEA
jgi:hypothetical protein